MISRSLISVACLAVGGSLPAAAEPGDLEERVAELEATTARKGNRKVSLAISGWVTEQLMWWDDGFESNAYVSGRGTTLGTNVKVSGTAKIAPGWSAGYVLRLELDGSDGRSLNQNAPVGVSQLTGQANFVQVMESYWFMKSDTLGTVRVGLSDAGSAKAAMAIDASGSMEVANYQSFDYGGFTARLSSGTFGVPWSALLGCPDCSGAPLNIVRYDSPVFAGFSGSWTWGADDYWDVALRYAAEIGDFKVGAAASYSRSTSDGVQAVFSPFGLRSSYVQTGLYLDHMPTGLFAYGSYQYFDWDLTDPATYNDNHEIWYGKAGLRARWTPLGHSVVFGEYELSNDGATLEFFGVRGAASEMTLWGLGMVQEIDAAAMSLFVSYRKLSFDYSWPNQTFNYEDFSYVKAGAQITF